MLNWVAGSVSETDGIAIKRYQFLERPIGDDDTCRVGGGVAVKAFELERDVDQGADRSIAQSPSSSTLRRGSCSILEPVTSLTGLAGFIGISFESRSTWP